MVQVLNNSGRLVSRGEVGERKASEDAIIKMIVEGIRKRQIHFCHELHKLLLFNRERNVLNNNRGRDQLVVWVVHCIRTHLLSGKWRRA